MMALEREAPEAAHWPRAEYETAMAGAAPRRLSLVIETATSAEAPGFIVAREVDREWEIENIVVSSAERRKGLGLRLLTALLDAARARAATAAFLEVRESNIAARRMYEKAGFIHRGIRPAYYHDPEENAAVYHLNFL